VFIETSPTREMDRLAVGSFDPDGNAIAYAEPPDAASA
jgi:hypothetical protein